MKQIQAIFTGQQAEKVETRPLLPQEWRPAGGDLIPLPGREVERVINRVVQNGNVTIFEQEIVFVPEPEEPYEIFTYYGHRGPGHNHQEEEQMLADWHAGRARFVGGPMTPDQALRTRARVSNGRIVLWE